MSNKTQLQTNNTNLAALIETLRGKAAGGGASVETCTIKATPDSPGSDGVHTVWYIDGNLSLKTATQPLATINTYEVAKNTILALEYDATINSIDMNYANGSTVLFANKTYGLAAIHVVADGSIYY